MCGEKILLGFPVCEPLSGECAQETEKLMKSHSDFS